MPGDSKETSPPRSPLSSAALTLRVGLSTDALDLDETTLAPSLHRELAVELVLSERLGGSPVRAR